MRLVLCPCHRGLGLGICGFELFVLQGRTEMFRGLLVRRETFAVMAFLVKFGLRMV